MPMRWWPIAEPAPSRRALALRERLYDKPFYRLIHAEADGLPGTIIDRFGDAAVIQPNAAWADRMIGELADALRIDLQKYVETRVAGQAALRVLIKGSRGSAMDRIVTALLSAREKTSHAA